MDPRPFAEVELAVQKELGRPIAELFAEFEPEARAAASLAQVMLHTSGGDAGPVLCCTIIELEG